MKARQLFLLEKLEKHRGQASIFDKINPGVKNEELTPKAFL
jgi:hypothetical protein